MRDSGVWVVAAAVVAVVTVGCGAAADGDPASKADLSSRRSAAATENTTGAEIEAGTEDAGARHVADAGGNACYCAQVTVSCKNGAGFASSNRAACTIALSGATCAALGVTTGATMDPLAILARTPPTSIADLYDFCATEHEARHTCDDPRFVTAAATEENAYAASISCFRQFAEAAGCDGPMPPPLCKRVETFIRAHEAALAFNTCLSDPSTTCRQCLGECSARFPDMEPSCVESAEAYCKVNGKGP